MNGVHTQELATILAKELARTLRLPVEDIDPDATFADYGMSSREAIAWIGDLERATGGAISPLDLYCYPTLRALARHLADSPHQEVEEVDATAQADLIAVIGIGCRFPMASGPEAYWRLLNGGVDAIRPMPRARPGADAFYAIAAEDARFERILLGGFLDDVAEFDAEFFGFTTREARATDPQQRLLLEVTWEALEDAGTMGETDRSSDTGVFVGIGGADYARLFPDLFTREPHGTVGNALSIAANRLSHTFDFRGPSLAIDTACSSSLVAVHAACEALRRGECRRAVAAGVNLILAPDISVGLTLSGFLSPTGRCRTFDAEADGYVRGEGAGVVVLKPFGDALRDGDTVYAVVRGSAVNNDGRSNGLTAPNGSAQEHVIRRAARRSRIGPNEIDYVELHGTGTGLGDPIEARALGRSLLAGRAPDAPCLVGSAKTNIGHLEAAAGIAGFIKAVLAIYHRTVPPSLHHVRNNEHIANANLPLTIAAQSTSFHEQRPMAIAVSSFGFGGTNAHAILSSVSVPVPASAATARERPLSAPPSRRWRHALYWYDEWTSLEENIAGQRLSAGAAVERIREFVRARTSVVSIDALVVGAPADDGEAGPRRYRFSISRGDGTSHNFRVEEKAPHLPVWRVLCRGVCVASTE
jgi:acyl transferase domain-containing protein/acyl carrier protein